MIKNILLTIAFLLIAFLAFANTHGFGNLGDPALVDSATDDELINKFKAEANTASFTAYPVYFTQGKPLQNVGDVIGLFMEQGGMENVVPGKDTFLRKDGSDLEQIADDFASFIKSRKGVSDYSLYSEVLGSQKSGVSEIRFVLVNSEGKLVWKYRSVKGSSDFKKYYPSNPMTCCMMISSIIKKEIKLKKRSGFNVREGKMTTYWAKNTGVPGKKEQEAIKSRASIARKSYKTSSITIFPMVVWGPVNDQFTKSTDISSSENVAAMLNGKVFASALVIDHKGGFDFEGSNNQAKVLWALANKFSAYLKANPVDTDYALIAHYSFDRSGKANGLHIIGCTGSGEFVEVVLFNRHNKEFRNAAIDSNSKADKFLVGQVKGYLK